jgi:hypothetical protein
MTVTRKQNTETVADWTVLVPLPPDEFEVAIAGGTMLVGVEQLDDAMLRAAGRMWTKQLIATARKRRATASPALSSTGGGGG